MSEKINRSLTPLAWTAYLLIGVEILYMISPFALYYYGTYGPSLNFLHQWPATAWLTGFFLPHYVQTSSSILNALHGFGGVLFVAGLGMFLVGAGQVYYAKFSGNGAVTNGLYRFVRNPQYTALGVMGLGLLLVWPRFTVLIMYSMMLFVYYFLAKQEERECEGKFGDAFRGYAERTPMFFPWRISIIQQLPALPKSGIKRVVANLALFFGVLVFFLVVGFWVREISVRNLSALNTSDSATISTVRMLPEKIEKIMEVALDVPEVQDRLAQAGFGAGEKFLNYVVPLTWFLPDLPLEVIPEGVYGHHQPDKFNRDEFKVLFTKARLFRWGPVPGLTCNLVTGPDIIKRTFGRVPIIVVKLNVATREILGVETPPSHVRWGDIPTPLF